MNVSSLSITPVIEKVVCKNTKKAAGNGSLSGFSCFIAWI
jgi:hypothetical protein